MSFKSWRLRPDKKAAAFLTCLNKCLNFSIYSEFLKNAYLFHSDFMCELGMSEASQKSQQKLEVCQKKTLLIANEAMIRGVK